MLQAYMDDSGSHDGAPVCTIAGYFGGYRRWLEFESAWGDVLVRYGVGEFHAKRFWGRDKQGRRLDEYREWDDGRANSFIDELLGIIERTKIYPFACGVQAKEWKKKPIGDRRILTGGNGKYPTGKPSKSIFLALERCVLRVADYCKPGIKVHYFIDSNQQLDEWATICYGQMKRLYKENKDALYMSMGDFTPSDSETALPLQAADLLAYEARLFGEAVISSGNINSPMRISYRRALRNMRSREDFWMFDSVRFGWLEKEVPEAIGGYDE